MNSNIHDENFSSDEMNKVPNTKSPANVAMNYLWPRLRQEAKKIRTESGLCAELVDEILSCFIFYERAFRAICQR